MTMSEVNESTFGRLINISARQRMLSQRIGFLFMTISTALHKTEEPPENLLALLRTAADDFVEGYRILQQGKPEDGLPHLNTLRIRNILGQSVPHGKDGSSGRAVIERFLGEVSNGIEHLSQGKPMSDDQADWFSRFILIDLLAVLQSIVAAIETDFSEEMDRRRELRNADAARVMQALQDIQKASKFSRMIALNAKISADRAGPHGREFGALTDEIKQIANDITDSSQDILKHLSYV
ncbi:type IV pili methyl-accepting chemotaxis transducer N-terminal domain-containing protein [uncultured Roseibium sp.]|uniref:type IV pili methyl-accepting chemotaxis transducer N-terminal domain-containing protein n=1 Tax=uncultured Roseibium sp. TaxID=1936171 RepID=UPI003216A637